MTSQFIEFIQFFGASALILFAFVFAYTKITPYHEFDLIKANNPAAAISLGGAMLGFAIVLASVIFATHSVKEMAIWAAIMLAVQLAAFVVARVTVAKNIEEGNIAQAIFLAATSVSVGLLSAASITY